jgi:large conductance mechanosensitive channel
MSILKEFKEFALKGNVVDLAVGVIIGGAFGKIVTSLVNDVIMPPIGVLLGGADFKELKATIKSAIPAVMDGEKVIAPEVAAVTLNYGAFLQTVVDFTIIAFCIFALVKAMNKLKKEKTESTLTPPEPSNEERLLTEIRDLLKK